MSFQEYRDKIISFRTLERIQTPTENSIRFALNLIDIFEKRNICFPFFISPTGDGGIIITTKAKDHKFLFEFWNEDDVIVYLEVDYTNSIYSGCDVIESELEEYVLKMVQKINEILC